MRSDLCYLIISVEQLSVAGCERLWLFEHMDVQFIQVNLGNGTDELKDGTSVAQGAEMSPHGLIPNVEFAPSLHGVV